MSVDMQKFIQSGYTYHSSDLYVSIEGTRHLYQKCVSDGKGERYYINVWYFEAQSIGNTQIPEGLSPKVQFYGDDDEVMMNVSLFDKNTPEEIEAEFDRIWTDLNLGYYEIHL